MKTYSIGRDLKCDIVISDNTDVISRRHALINVYPTGKMTIIDQSSNGTYVNGIRISPNVAVPVSRKDVVSLAHVSKLDWRQVPRDNSWLVYLFAGIAVAVVVLAFIFGFRSCGNGNEEPVNSASDTSAIETPAAIPQGQTQQEGAQPAEENSNPGESSNKDQEEADNTGKEKEKEKEASSKDSDKDSKESDKDSKESDKEQSDKVKDKEEGKGDKEPSAKPKNPKRPTRPSTPKKQPSQEQPMEPTPVG